MNGKIENRLCFFFGLRSKKEYLKPSLFFFFRFRVSAVFFSTRPPFFFQKETNGLSWVTVQVCGPCSRWFRAAEVVRRGSPCHFVKCRRRELALQTALEPAALHIPPECHPTLPKTSKTVPRRLWLSFFAKIVLPGLQDADSVIALPSALARAAAVPANPDLVL
jgi:hypothetical protein